MIEVSILSSMYITRAYRQERQEQQLQYTPMYLRRINCHSHRFFAHRLADLSVFLFSQGHLEDGGMVSGHLIYNTLVITCQPDSIFPILISSKYSE